MLPVRLRGARLHNLRAVDLDLAPGTFVALTGPSGAGKSTLALDTLHAEGQRRFVESFSPYARQFLERRERPPVDALDPIAATVAVDRKSAVKSSRSTLATLTDLEAYLAALFAKLSQPFCDRCQRYATSRTPLEVAEALCAARPGARVRVEVPIAAAPSVEAYLHLRERLAAAGWRRLSLRGQVVDLDELRPADAVAAGDGLAIVLDRVVLGPAEASRLVQAFEAAWEGFVAAAEGPVRAVFVDGDEAPLLVERGLTCPGCARAFERPRPGFFSYDSPLGACPSCRGFGRSIGVDWKKVVPDPSLSLARGAIKAWAGKSATWERGALAKYCAAAGISMTTPWRDLPEAHRQKILEGDSGFDGVRKWFAWLETRTYKMHVRVFLARYREYLPCATCAGARLRPEARAYRIEGRDLPAFHGATVAEAHALVKKVLATRGAEDPQGRLVAEELSARLAYLEAVGLGYLTLDRQARTLSGGETQRAALTTALGARLSGALYLLDEPTVGLHPADVPPLVDALRNLAAQGNTVVAIEHDRAVIAAADRAVELGPGAGRDGGSVQFDGPPAALFADLRTATGRAAQAPLFGEDGLREAAPAKRRAKTNEVLTIRGVRALLEGRPELLHTDVLRVPLGRLVAVVGPSGSGKSTLTEDVLVPALERHLAAKGEGSSVVAPGVRAVVHVDQAPLGRTARGNAATYTKAWGRIRKRFAAEPDAIRRGFTPSTFSFNVRGESGGSGRCEACDGEGYETVEMQFLADVRFLCPVCQGRRFQADVLRVKHLGLDVAEVLAMTVADALQHFAGDPELQRALRPLADVGLGYLPLGQPLATLSGGEAQRLKLARAFATPAKGTVFVVDEPSAGLHAVDAAPVQAALRALVDAGGTVVMVEHDLAMIAPADHVIELGPGGGPDGGHVVFEGSVAALLAAPTKTGRALQAALDGQTRGEGAPAPAAPKPRAAPAIEVVRAREHTLKNVSCTIPHGALTVFSGPSGSGKSSLAFDVVFAEGQRRFLDTLSPYARQFLPTLPRPDVDGVVGVPPAIALEQRTTRGGAHSTVATVTEIGHYLRLLWAKVGTVHCPSCGEPVAALSSEELRAAVRRRGASNPAPHTVYAPAVRARKGTYLELFAQAARAGIRTARVDGALVEIEPPPRLAKTREHTIDFIVFYGPLAAVTDVDLDRALSLGDGALRLHPGGPTRDGASDEILSTRRACLGCGAGVPEVDPRWFSWNTAQGRCPSCEGAGVKEGTEIPCPRCAGTRLAPLPRGVTLPVRGEDGAPRPETFPAFQARDIASALTAAERFALDGSARTREIADAPVRELTRRLRFLVDIGLGYLALDRPAATLSGGEMQRLRLAAQLGAGLTGALYVLDEPTIGLHPRDTDRLLGNLRRLVATGSTVLVVEHDEAVLRAADHLIDVGPTGGRGGGRILAEGPLSAVLASPESATARALLPRAEIPLRDAPPTTPRIAVRGASAHNLRAVDVEIPTAAMTVVAGVSGSGKSTLVRRVFLPALREALGLVTEPPLAHRGITLPEGCPITRAILVDQSPIGRSPRSVPATFLGIFDELRKLWAAMPAAKARGFGPARFSFNTGKGRCATCEGQGVVVSEMSFLPDVTSVCPACHGLRYEPETAAVTYLGRSLGEALALSAEEALPLFENHPKIRRPLAMMVELGVGYIQLGQGSHTLSGGEAQRLKLAAELAEGARHEPTVYVLDEPSTGLHLDDVTRLLAVFRRLVARGDTLVIVEHHPDVVRAADWVIELGPEAGRDGGQVVFTGTPPELVAAETATAEALRAGGARFVRVPKGPEEAAFVVEDDGPRPRGRRATKTEEPGEKPAKKAAAKSAKKTAKKSAKKAAKKTAKT